MIIMMMIIKTITLIIIVLIILIVLVIQVLDNTNNKNINNDSNIPIMILLYLGAVNNDDNIVSQDNYCNMLLYLYNIII